MSYIHFELDVTSDSAIAIVSLKGVESDVLLMDRTNFDRLRRGSSYQYRGGHFRRSPARIPVPGPGEWHVVVVPGPGGRVEATLQVA